MGRYVTVEGTEPSGTAADPFAPGKLIDAECSQALSGRAGMIGLLAVPVAVLAAVSLLGRRRPYDVTDLRKDVRKVLAFQPDPAEPAT